MVFERRRVFRFPILFIAKYVTGFPSRLGGPSKTSACSLLGVISIPTKASASARPVAADDKMNFSPPPSPDMRGKDPSAGLRYRHSWLLINGETPPTILQRKIQAAGTMKDGKTLRVRARACAPPRTSTHMRASVPRPCPQLNSFINHQVDCQLMNHCGQLVRVRVRVRVRVMGSVMVSPRQGSGLGLGLGPGLTLG